MAISLAPADAPAPPRMATPGVRPRASVAGERTAYSAASRANQNIALWRPPLRSADAEILRDGDKVRARARDLVRNHPYARQALRVSRLGVIGKRLRYSCRPDHRFLGIDFEEAVRWGQEFERLWESYAHSPRFAFDAGRRGTFTQVMSLAHDCRFTDGEALVAGEWARDRRWKTCFQVVDVDRLSNPNGAPETAQLKGGVALGELSEPLGYWIRDAHPGDHGLVGNRHMTWSFVPRETAWGRLVMAHVYEHARAGQTRGISEFASVIAAMKMGQEYTDVALQAAILQASYAAVLVSQQNYREALEIINASPPDEHVSVVELAEQNLEAALDYHEKIKLRFQGAEVPILWPGEDLKLLTPGQTANSLKDFQSHATKSYAAGLGTDPISVSQDYSDVNYSSAKMAVANNWRQYEARREDLITGIGLPAVGSFLEESVFQAGMWLPRGLSPLDFYEIRDALTRGTFITAGAPMLDPVKERQGQQLGIALGAETLQGIVAEQGEDYLDVLDQLQREQMEKMARGLVAPPMAPPPTDTGEPQQEGTA